MRNKPKWSAAELAIAAGMQFSSVATLDAAALSKTDHPITIAFIKTDLSDSAWPPTKLGMN
jgi:hypothetical protein